MMLTWFYASNLSKRLRMIDQRDHLQKCCHCILEVLRWSLFRHAIRVYEMISAQPLYVCKWFCLLIKNKSSWTYQGSRFLAFWGLKKKHVLIYCHLNQLQKSECVRLSMHLTGNNPPQTKVEMISRHIFLPSCAMDATLRLQAQLFFGEPSVGDKRYAAEVMDSLPPCLVEATHVIHLKDWGVRLWCIVWIVDIWEHQVGYGQKTWRHLHLSKLLQWTLLAQKNRGSYSDRKYATYCW